MSPKKRSKCSKYSRSWVRLKAFDVNRRLFWLLIICIDQVDHYRIKTKCCGEA